jgi:drug/metabolite transporter (DMT)-like permease
MRGLAPLIAAVIALATLGEAPAPIAGLGVVTLVAGVLAMGASGLAHGRIDRPTIMVALANSAVIAVYSVIDGQGARVSGAGAAFAFAYNSWADALTALAYLPIVLCLRGRAMAAAFAQGGRRGFVGGLAAYLGYAIVIWAMTRAPIAAVAALRETSVVFAAIIGVVALGEPFLRNGRLPRSSFSRASSSCGSADRRRRRGAGSKPAASIRMSIAVEG